MIKRLILLLILLLDGGEIHKEHVKRVRKAVHAHKQTHVIKRHKGKLVLDKE